MKRKFSQYQDTTNQDETIHLEKKHRMQHNNANQENNCPCTKQSQLFENYAPIKTVFIHNKCSILPLQPCAWHRIQQDQSRNCNQKPR